MGGFLGESGGWRWVAALLAILSAVLTVAGALFSPETYAPVLLRRRAKTLEKATGMVYKTHQDAKEPFSIKKELNIALKRPWVLLFKESIVLLLSI